MMAAPFLRITRTAKAFSIRAHLIAFALALILPMMAFAGLLLWRDMQAEEARITEEMRQIAEQVGMIIDRELVGTVALLQTLAASSSLDTGDLAAFRRQATDALRYRGGYIELSDASGRPLVDTQGASADAVAGATSHETVARVIATGQPDISDLERDAKGEPVTMVSVPVFKGGRLTHVLSLGVSAEHWREILDDSMHRPGWAAGLVDRNGIFIARLREHGRFVGLPAPDGLRFAEGTEGVKRSTDPEGQPVLLGYWRSSRSDWLVGVNIPLKQVVQAPRRRSATLVLALGFGLFGLSLVLAAVFGRRIAQPLRLLSNSAARLGRGDAVPPLSTNLSEVNEVGRNLAAASVGLRERSAALRVSEERYRLATEAFQGTVFDFDVASNRSDRTPRHYEIVGEPPGVIPTTKEGWHERIHPEDKPTFERARRTVFEGNSSQYEAEYRVRHHDGSWVWVWHRALAMRDERGVVRRVVGAVLDITARKHAEEHLKLLVNELNHRVKNTLATVQSISAQSLRGAATVEEARGAFEARLMALSRAHDILTRQNWEGASLRSIAVEVLEPYRDRWADRFRIDGPDVWVRPASAVSIAMGLHELATNAVKYGALASDRGHVQVCWAIEEEMGRERVRLTWTEHGGPPVKPPSSKGFGMRLIQRSLAADLGGETRLDFRPEGVVCTLTWALDWAEAAETSAYPARAFAAVR
jgi:PAS domain S-box-containing protein